MASGAGETGCRMKRYDETGTGRIEGWVGEESLDAGGNTGRVGAKVAWGGWGGGGGNSFLTSDGSVRVHWAMRKSQGGAG